MNGHSHNQQRHQANKSAIRIPQGNNETNRSLSNNYISYSTNKTSLIEQQQQHRTTDIQLINNSIQQQQQVPQFSYNPLYMGPVQHYSNDAQREDKSQNNLDELTEHHERHHGEHMTTGDNLLDRDRDEEEDVLNDIYHYQSDSTENSCNKHQHHNQLQATFEHRDGSDMNSQCCDRIQQQQSVNTTGFIGRKQDVVGQFGALQRPQSRPISALGSSQCRSQQQQQSFQIQAYSDGSMAQQFPQIMSACQPPNGNNKQKRKVEQDQIGPKRRLNSHQLVNNYNNQFQQQQFTLSSSNPGNGSQIDLSEECNGLFVEYQTNRNSLGGLEELNSLNVSNCDGETLEEHINILSSEDCFATNDDLQDFGIGSTNDHFLNMIFLNNNNNQIMNGCGNVVQSSQQIASQNTIDNLHQISMTPSNSSSHCESQIISGNTNSNQIICEQPHQQQPNKQLGDQIQSSSCSDLSNQVVPTASIAKTKATKSTKNTSTSNKLVNNNNNDNNNNDSLPSKSSKNVGRKQGGSGKRKAFQQTETSYEMNISQDKIATTNTNKRLMPKKQGQQTISNKQVGKKINSSTTSLNASTSASPWMASPSSTSNTSISSATSPNSNSQFDYEAPYRQQLENLRKKLKMDVVPMSTAATLVDDQVTNSQVNNNNKNNASRLINQQASLASYNIFHSAQSKVEQQQQQQSTNFSDQIDSLNTVTNIAGNTIFVSQQQQQEQRPNALSCATTYVIARSIDSHNFETNGTVYLRTPNGLVPINSDRRSNLPIVSLATTNDLDYSNSTSSSTSSSNSNPSSNSNQPTTGTSTITTTNLTNQSGPTSVILRVGPSNDNNNNTNGNTNNNDESSVASNRVEAAQILSSTNHNLRGGDDIVGSMKGGKNVAGDDQSLISGQIIGNTDCANQTLATVSTGDKTHQVIISDPTSSSQSSYCDNERQQNDLIIGTSQYQQHVNAPVIQQQQQQQQHVFASREPAMQLDMESSSCLAIKSLPSDQSINVSN